MINVSIKIGENTLWVEGKYLKAEPEVGLAEGFEIYSIESQEKDITDVLLWANSMPKGFLLEEIENLVLQKVEQ